MNIIYVEYYLGMLKYHDCHAHGVYNDIYIRMESWGNRNRRKMNLLAIL